MKIVDERETPKQNIKKERKEQAGTEGIVKGWKLNDFAVHSSKVFAN